MVVPLIEIAQINETKKDQLKTKLTSMPAKKIYLFTLVP